MILCSGGRVSKSVRSDFRRRRWRRHRRMNTPAGATATMSPTVVRATTSRVTHQNKKKNCQNPRKIFSFELNFLGFDIILQWKQKNQKLGEEEKWGLIEGVKKLGE